LANYSCLFRTFINPYYNPKNIKTFLKNKIGFCDILLVFMLFIACFLSFFLNMILNDLRFDFHQHF
jgi:hypothetical protein